MQRVIMLAGKSRCVVRGSKYFSSYVTEAAEMIAAARQGKFPGVDPEEIKKCDFCNQIYYETMEGRSLEELPPVCAVREHWIKQWMMYHDSYNLYSKLSLDESENRDDEMLQRVANDSVVVPRTRCGLYCCENNEPKE